MMVELISYNAFEYYNTTLKQKLLKLCCFSLFNFWLTLGLRGRFTWKRSSVTFKPFKYLISNNSVDLPLKTVASILLHQDRQGAYNLMQNHLLNLRLISSKNFQKSDGHGKSSV